MTFISWYFLFGLAVALVLYYAAPTKYRWIILLLASIIFYSRSGWKMLLAAVASGIFTWSMGIAIARVDRKNKKRRLSILWCGITLLTAVLIFMKMIGRFELSAEWLIMPIGISYYTFSSISYIADIYWGKEDAERNPMKFLLFILYFPKIVQGPIEKHHELAPKLIEGHRIHYQNITYGMQLMTWGFFKKLVIANRAAIYVNAVHEDLNKFLTRGGGYILWMSMLSVIELYFDFSGYVDIISGISQMFGINLRKNFNHPFFSKSAAEFWRRWHITLGVWFKDYVYMPLSVNPKLIQISGKIKNRYGMRHARAFMTAAPLAIVWMLTGLWHGTGLNYIVWGIYWGAIIILSTVFAPELKTMSGILHINQKNVIWKGIQVTRTSIIYLFARILSSWSSLSDSGRVIKAILTNMHADQTIEIFKGLPINEKYDYLIIMIGVILLLFVSLYEENIGSVRDLLSRWWAVPRWVVYSLMVIIPIYLGIYGVDNSLAGAFAYTYF